MPTAFLFLSIGRIFIYLLKKKPALLHLFLSMPERNEVDTSFIRNDVEANHPEIKIAVPVVDALTDTLKHVWVAPDVELVKSRFGVPEPKMQSKIIRPQEMDMVLVPLLGFDGNGNRLGYGKGHYDGFLKSVRPDCLKIGLAFEISRCTEPLPVEPHDIQLDYMITELGIQAFLES